MRSGHEYIHHMSMSMSMSMDMSSRLSHFMVGMAGMGIYIYSVDLCYLHGMCVSDPSA